MNILLPDFQTDKPVKYVIKLCCCLFFFFFFCLLGRREGVELLFKSTSSAGNGQ